MHVIRTTVCIAALLASVTDAAAQSGLTQRASVDFSGGDASAASFAPSLSDDGRYVAFQSAANDLLTPGLDTNNCSDVFVRDTLTGTTSRVSVGPLGVQGDGDSLHPSISADGSRVAFASRATNLVPFDTNQSLDIFVVDVATLVVRRVSVSSAGVEASGPSIYPALSSDGRCVAYESTAFNLDPADNDADWDVFWTEIATGTTLLVSRSLTGVSGAGPSGGDDHDGPDISDDGKYVTFWSRAPDLVVGDTNGPSGPPPICITCGDDVFVRDVITANTVRVSVSSTGGQASNASLHPAISGSGRFVAFYSRASDLVAANPGPWSDMFVHDRDADGNGIFDEAGGISTVIVSVSSAGVQATGSSGGGGFGWKGPDLSRDGKRVAFFSQATNLDPGDTNAAFDIYVRDLTTGITSCASVDPLGVSGNQTAHSVALSGDGARVAFVGLAGSLVAGDGNGFEDVFVRRSCVSPVAYCTAKTNSLGCTSAIDWTGTPSGSTSVPFTIHAGNVRNKSHGTLVFSLVGPLGAPFQGGTLCVHAPIKRTPVSFSGGSATGVDCSGNLSFDFNAFAQSGANPALIDGANVWAQFWSRDGGDPFTSNLSNALAFTLCGP
jgi:Tol biopolymer transport system component